MPIEIITKEDLQQFKSELIEELLKIIKPDQAQAKQWLKSQDVRKLLNISPGTLQNLRINGTLRFTQVGTIYITTNRMTFTTCLKTEVAHCKRTFLLEDD